TRGCPSPTTEKVTEPRGACRSLTPTTAYSSLQRPSVASTTSATAWVPSPRRYTTPSIDSGPPSPAAVSPLLWSRSTGPQPLLADTNGISLIQVQPGGGGGGGGGSTVTAVRPVVRQALPVVSAATSGAVPGSASSPTVTRSSTVASSPGRSGPTGTPSAGATDQPSGTVSARTPRRTTWSVRVRAVTWTGSCSPAGTPWSGTSSTRVAGASAT